MQQFICETTEDLQIKRAIVVGSVGAGKTSLCMYVSGNYKLGALSKMSGHSITKGTKTHKGKYIELNPETKVQFQLTDTEGYGSDNFSTDVLRNQILEAMRFETDLGCVILVASFERFRNGLKDDLSHVIGVIKSLGIENSNLILCLTHCEMYTTAVRESYLNEFKEYYSLNDFAPENIIYGCFANIDEINDEFKTTYGDNISRSIKELRNLIFNRSTSLNVASKINEIENI
jgi:GTPase SAR1 family protein